VTPDRFWELLAPDPARGPGGWEQGEVLRERLAGLAPGDLAGFDRALRERVRALDTWDLWAVFHLAAGPFGDFPAFRAWVVSRGAHFFGDARRDPEWALAWGVPDEESLSAARDLLGAAEELAAQQGGSAIAPQCEPWPREPAGRPFFEDEALARHPRLARRLGWREQADGEPLSRRELVAVFREAARAFLATRPEVEHLFSERESLCLLRLRDGAGRDVAVTCEPSGLCVESARGREKIFCRRDVDAVLKAIDRLIFPARVSCERRRRIQRLRRSCEERPGSAAAARRLGDALCDAAWEEVEEQRRHLGDAVEAYERALALAPEDPAALNNLGAALCDLGDPGRALELLERALVLRRDDGTILHNLAAALLACGETARGREAHARARLLESGLDTREATWDCGAL
jgi:tetratricopeptide (TPR) repeat protein